MARTNQRYGWRRDIPDPRDLLHPVTRDGVGFPPSHSLRPEFPAPYYQGRLGSCTANAIAAVLEHAAARAGRDTRTPSRLFIYYGEREIEGTISSDAGAEIRDGIKVVARLGAPPETDWPYSDQNPGPFQQKPSAQAYKDAQNEKAIRYYRNRQDNWDLKWCVTHDYPVVFGFTVFDSFESPQVARDGLVPMPDAASESVLGGHAVVIVGYDDTKRLPGGIVGAYEVRNSWSSGWGDSGYCWMPYGYLGDPNLASDMWTIRLAT